MKNTSVIDSFLDIVDFVKYDIFKKKIEKIKLPSELRMRKGYDKENGTYWLECDDLPGFVASASSEKQLLKEVYETLLVYFDVPRYLAKRMNKYGELVMSGGRKIKMVDTDILLNYAG